MKVEEIFKLEFRIRETNEEIMMLERMIKIDEKQLEIFSSHSCFKYQKYIQSLTKELMDDRIERLKNRLDTLNQKKKEFIDEWESKKNGLTDSEKELYLDIIKNSTL